MKTTRYCLGLFGLAALAATTGCNSPSPTSNLPPNTLLMNPANKTEAVGQPNWISGPDMALLQLNRKPYPANTVLVALDQNKKPTAYLATTQDSVVTKDTHITYQGAKVFDGVLGADDQIVRPGPEFNLIGQIAINNYQAKQDASAAPMTTSPSPTDTAAKSSAAVPSS